MSEIKSPIIIVGPTTVGKTDVAHALAAEIDPVIVNADKYGLYADGNYFEVGLGLKPGELYDERDRRLVGCLSPSEPLPSPEAYAHMAGEAVNGIHSLGKVAVVEGCSYRYNQALINYFGVSHAVNLTWAEKAALPDVADQRFVDALAWGLLDETQRALDAGYEGTVPMSSMLYRPAIRLLRHEIDAEEARRLCLENLLDNALEHDGWYAATPGLRRLIHHRQQPIQTAQKILELFCNDSDTAHL